MTDRRRLTNQLQQNGFARLEVGGRTFRFQYGSDFYDTSDGAYFRAARDAVGQVDELLEYREELREAGQLTAEGIAEKLEEKAAELADTSGGGRGLRTAAEYSERLRREVEEARRDLRPVEPADPGDARATLKEIDTLQRLEELDVRKRRRVATRAAKEGRETVVRAVLNADPELTAISPGLQESVRNVALEAHHGEVLEKVQAKTKARDRLEKIAATAREAMQAIVAEPGEPDPR